MFGSSSLEQPISVPCCVKGPPLDLAANMGPEDGEQKDLIVPGDEPERAGQSFHRDDVLPCEHLGRAEPECVVEVVVGELTVDHHPRIQGQDKSEKDASGQ